MKAALGRRTQHRRESIMAKATAKKATASKAKADEAPEAPEAPETAVPEDNHLDTGADGQPTADSHPVESDDELEQESANVEPIAPADKFGQPTEQKKVDQSPNVEHPTVAPGNEEAAEPLHNPELVEEHANQLPHVVSTEDTKDHSDPSEVAQAALADPDVPLGQDADPNGPDDLR
jgi:hypothetical protein